MPFRKILPRIPCRVNTNIDVVFFAGPGLHRTSFHVCHVLKTNTKCKSPNKDHLLLIRAFYLLSGRQGSLSHRGRERVGWLDPGDAVVAKEINPKVSLCQDNIRRVRLDVSIFCGFLDMFQGHVQAVDMSASHGIHRKRLMGFSGSRFCLRHSSR